VAALPTFIPPRESKLSNGELASRYPLSMMSPKAHSFLNSEYANIRRQQKHEGEQYVLLHPDDASERGIGPNDPVKVENRRGAFIALAKVGDETMRGVVVAPLGHWISTSRGEATPAALNPVAYADLGRAPTFSDNLVQVSLAR
jgi:anaerobic selenocysteine-containing dehydrogenase